MIETGNRKDIRHEVKKLPKTPGVYIFKDDKGKVIYVGKAKSLKSRISTYFQKNISLGSKTQAMVRKINNIEVIKTSSELEALILEAELIKKHKPRYNIVHKDDKSYLYIVARNDTLEINGKKVKLPKILTARKADLQKGDVKYGPYPSANTARLIVRTIRKVFPYRDCGSPKFNRYQKLGRPCLYGHLDLCGAPCQPENSYKEYKKEIRRIKNFLSGKSSAVIKEYENKMKNASKDQDYEKAAYFRDMLKRFEYIRTSFKTADKYIENPNLLEDLAKEAMNDLKENIEILNILPERIECFDISNISGKEAVGSMVVAVKGIIQKSEYKRFKIKLKDEPDDVFMMREVLERRLNRVGRDVKSWDDPSLIILDGGKGQVSAIDTILKEKKLNIPVVGIAKKAESLIFLNNGEFVELDLPKDSPGLKLAMRLRDEAHRFAQTYHHHLRLKNFKV